MRVDARGETRGVTRGVRRGVSEGREEEGQECGEGRERGGKMGQLGHISRGNRIYCTCRRSCVTRIKKKRERGNQDNK